jgi:hypothetical protein
VLHETRLQLYAFLTSAITELHGRVIYAGSCMRRWGDAAETAVRQNSISYGARNWAALKFGIQGLMDWDDQSS